MPTPVSRRDALKHLGAAGAAAALAPRLLFQTGAITVSGRPVEVTVFSMNATTLRLVVAPLVDGVPAPVPDDGVLDAGQFRAMPRPARASAALVRVAAGDLVVRFADSPPTFTIETAKGAPVQRITLGPNGPTTRTSSPSAASTSSCGTA
jgi:hypothetical protein